MRGRASVIARLAGLALALITTIGNGSLLRAQEAPPTVGDWEATGLTEPVWRLFTPISGAFYAVAADKLLRSDDAGETWRAVPLPPGAEHFAVDPTDHGVLFVGGKGGLSKSVDGGAAWTTMLLIGAADARPWATERRFLDPGWFRNAERLAGGGGAAPGRFYAAFSVRLTPYNQSTETLLLRTDDDGDTQEMLLRFNGGGGVSGKQDGEPLPPAVFADGLTYDPAAPDHVYVGLNEYTAAVCQTECRGDVRLTLSRSRVIASADGGATWANLHSDLGAEIHNLALGIDGANLYAATESGVPRLRLR